MNTMENLDEEEVKRKAKWEAAKVAYDHELTKVKSQEKKYYGYGGVIVSVIVLTVVGSLLNKTESAPDHTPVVAAVVEVAQPVAKAPEPKGQTIYDAYGAGCDFMRSMLGIHGVKFEMNREMCTDYGDGQFIVQGWAKYGEHQKRWTIELKWLPGEQQWQRIGKPVVADEY